jgi:hypothetical protein
MDHLPMTVETVASRILTLRTIGSYSMNMQITIPAEFYSHLY